MAKYINLTASEKDEIRRLTQLANRRVLAAARVYEKEFNVVLPREVVGDFQIYEKWQTGKSPISRSVKFESRKEYLKQLNMLRSFERTRVGIKEYTSIQRDKTSLAIKTSLGFSHYEDLPKSLQKKINQMTAPQLANFWNSFSDKAAKLGVKYSSGDAMDRAIAEYFNEDINKLLE